MDPAWNQVSIQYHLREAPTVQPGTCICRNCHEYDTATPSPDLPRWYKLVKEGHMRLQGSCRVCDLLGDQTNSTNTEPAYTCGMYQPQHMSLFYRFSYGVEDEFTTGNIRQLCSPHYQHFTYSLPLHLREGFQVLSGAHWVPPSKASFDTCADQLYSKMQKSLRSFAWLYA
jgi:hypothetical protein